MRILLDTNVLLVHATGMFDRSRLRDVKLGVLANPEEEYERLAIVITRATNVATTWSVLTEFANLAERKLALGGDAFVRFMDSYGDFLSRLDIVALRKDDLLASDALQFGLPDCSLVEAGHGSGAAIFTRDDALRGYCEAIGVPTFPFWDALFGPL